MKNTAKIILCFAAIIFIFAACSGQSGDETTTASGSEKPLSCSVVIDCKNAINSEDLKEEKRDVLPENGLIFTKDNVAFSEGKTAFDVLKTVLESESCAAQCEYCKKGILYEAQYTAAYDSYYIKGIHQLYEFDCGEQSGWISMVNGEIMGEALNKYEMKDGDVLKIAYSCDWGADLGQSIE